MENVKAVALAAQRFSRVVEIKVGDAET